jgi:hypothetical protein
VGRWLADTGAKAVLVRPDRYVIGTAHVVADMEALSGALAPYGSRVSEIKETV